MKIARRSLVIAVVAVIWALVLALDIIPQIRGDAGWRWPYEVPHEIARLWPLVSALIIYGLGARWLWRRSGSRGLLIWTMAGCLVLTLAALYVTGDPLFKLYTVTAGGVTGGWHYAAARINDLAATLRNWPAVMRQSVGFSSHMGISPPGMVVGYYLMSRLFEQVPVVANALGRPLRAALCDNFRVLHYTNAQFASVWPGMLLPLWGALTVFPLYRLGRRVFDEQTARWSMIWWPLVPGLLMFAPLPNVFYPFPTVITVIWLLAGLRHNRVAWVAAAGVLTSALTFLTFTFMPLILLAGLLIVILSVIAFDRSRPIGELVGHIVKMGLAYGAGLTVVWVIAYLAAGVSFVAIFQTALGAHLGLDRPYLPWLVLHPNDFFMFTGWPVSLLALIGVWQIARRVWQRRPLTEGDGVTLAFAITLIVLDASGTLRGEAGRILVFLAPFWLLIAARVVSADQTQAAARSGWIITGAQAVVLVVMVAFLRVLGSDLKAPLAMAPVVVQSPIGARLPIDAVFGSTLHLTQFAGQLAAASNSSSDASPQLEVALDWTSNGQVDVPYYLSFIPVAPDGQAAASAVLVQPFNGRYPTTCWSPQNGIMQDRIEVPLPKMQSGDWWLSLALVDGDTGRQLPVQFPDGSSDVQVGLGPFKVP